MAWHLTELMDKWTKITVLVTSTLQISAIHSVKGK